MKKKIPENWEMLVEDWNTTSPGGNYQIWKLRNWKKMRLKITLGCIDDSILSIK